MIASFGERTSLYIGPCDSGWGDLVGRRHSFTLLSHTFSSLNRNYLHVLDNYHGHRQANIRAGAERRLGRRIKQQTQSLRLFTLTNLVGSIIEILRSERRGEIPCNKFQQKNFIISKSTYSLKMQSPDPISLIETSAPLHELVKSHSLNW